MTLPLEAATSVSSAPVAIPGIVLGVGLFFTYTRPPFVLYGTLWILLIAFVTLSMPAVWDLNMQMQPPEFADFDDPDTIPADASLTYASYTMSALAMAATLGVEGTDDAYTWLREQVVNNSDAGVYIDRKWSITASIKA